ncbi:amidohydrolase family protein [Piscinibacter sakaiensis]|uniref:Putative 2-pyrone-4,6-dicarboxylic acid hydrolase n=1 Tax=Piscinibacter sakaiensis TaxID=1547922 RepID=A0A0K8NYJ0_PISS1|nr:amidohydrolase family protein [Piscinibacter sakaiensis]GAP35364.1 putative 2-pyrone-4,6-dicarboxylic acid hydrolase [Piscinibacter sakaiensis]
MSASDPGPDHAGWDTHVHVFDAAAPVRPGHYRPAHHPLADAERAAAAAGCTRLVLVQPSVYGSDNGVMLQALEASAGRHRGVAVVDPAVDDATLDRLHAAGVRGIRFNLVSPAGHAGDPGPALAALAPRLRARGWHVQWYAPAERLPDLLRWQAGSGLVFVLDHLAGLHAGLAADDPAWSAAEALAAGGAWIKLSGWYRLRAAPPYDALRPAIRRAAALFGERTLWGSDWPHTAFAPGSAPDPSLLLSPLRTALGDDALDAVRRRHPRPLYLDEPSPP